MVVVDDDIALPDLPQARGVAGTLFVHKIAGALAEAGASLEDVSVTATRVIAGTRSIGMSLDTCTVPGALKEDRIARGKAELGLGIHGEAGVEQVDYSDARSAMAMVSQKLGAFLAPGGNYVALLNNLGGASVLEMSVLAHELAHSDLAGRISHIVGPATMMTSLDMRGFSVSLCPATPETLAALETTTPLHNWPGVARLSKPDIIDLPDGLRPIRPLASQHPPTRDFLIRCCEILIAAEADLNALDAKTGDGDTGSTLAGAAKALIKAMDRLPLADHTQLYRAIGQELSETMGGSSGVLLAIFFAAAGDAAASGQTMGEALQAGLARMQEIGGARPGDRTMIDALEPALRVLPQGIAAAARAARNGANGTAEMVQARAGRAAYINTEQLRGQVDPGAEAVARLFEQLVAPV